MNFTGSPEVALTINGSVPGPLLRWREGDTVTLRVRNTLDQDTSIHWHGIILPANMDGVPGLSFHGIGPGETYTYTFKVKQAGTYWYHSHSGFQEQRGVYGPLVIDPRGPDPIASDREHVILLSDWTDESPERVFARLKKQSDYYNFNQRTLGDFFKDVRAQGLKRTLADRMAWGGMRMNPTDLADVGGATYTYLMNGVTPNGNWTGLFDVRRARAAAFHQRVGDDLFRRPHSRIEDDGGGGRRLARASRQRRRIPDRDRRDLRRDRRAERTGGVHDFRAGNGSHRLCRRHAGRPGRAEGAVPSLDPRPLLTMADMGHDMSAHAGHDMPPLPHPRPRTTTRWSTCRPMMPASKLDDPGIGLRDNGRRVLTYSDLRSVFADPDGRDPSRTIELHLTGHMAKFAWSFDGVKFADAEPLRLKYGERAAHRPRQRHDDDPSHPPARDVERSRERRR